MTTAPARRRSVGLALAGAMLVSGCGSTVALRSTQTVGGGLSDGSTLAPGGAAATGAPVAAGTIPGALAGTTTGGPGVTGPGSATSSGVNQLVTPTGAGGSGPLSPGAPIKIGVLVANSAAAAAALGANTSSDPCAQDPLCVPKALAVGINAMGGIAGHPIKLVTAVDNTDSSTPYESQNAAACTKFVQDEHVAAVITLDNGYWSGYNACLTRGGVPNIDGLYVEGDRQDYAREPGHFSAFGPSTDRRLTSVFTQGMASGAISSRTKLGILLEDCEYNLRAYTNTVVPLIQRLHLNVDREDLNCISSFSEVSQYTAAISAAILKFRSNGVDTVTMISDAEMTLLLLFAQAVDSQGWTPNYLLSTVANAQALYSTNNLPANQFKHVRGVGWDPLLDVLNPPTPAPAQQAARRACDVMARKGGLRPPAKDQDEGFLAPWCDAFQLLRRALTITGGLGGIPRVKAAIQSLGTSFAGVAFPVRFAPGQQDGIVETRSFAYAASCDCLRYVSGAARMP